jgi:hypothetical protein
LDLQQNLLQFSAICYRSTWQDLLSTTLLNPVRDSFFATGVLHVVFRAGSFPPTALEPWWYSGAELTTYPRLPSSCLGCIKLQKYASLQTANQHLKVRGFGIGVLPQDFWLKICKTLETLEGMSRL